MATDSTPEDFDDIDDRENFDDLDSLDDFEDDEPLQLTPEINDEALKDDAELAEVLKSAKLVDEDARILRADQEHGGSDIIMPDEQVSFLWHITPETVKALKKRHPFIQVAQIYDEGEEPPEYDLSFLDAESGWKIFDYGSAFAASKGEYCFGDGDFRIMLDNDDYVEEEEDDDEGEGGRILNPGKGTWINQAVMTAEELARLAVIREWKAAQLYDADPLMAWAFWAEASYYGLAVFGYEPTAADIAKRNRAKLTRRDLEDAIKEKRDIARLVL